MKIDLLKYRGLGCEYIIYDPNKINVEINEELIKKINYVNGNTNIDGILYGPITRNGKLECTLYNIYGNEIKLNMNAIRIFAEYLKDLGYVEEDDIKLSYCNQEILIQALKDYIECYKVHIIHNNLNRYGAMQMNQCEEINMDSIYIVGNVKQIGSIILYI